MTGKKFSRLLVLGLSPKKSGRKTFWVCRCDCGNKKVARSDSLKDGSLQSCGCLRDEQAAVNVRKNHTHKDSHTLLHYTWGGMRQRCSNPNDESYKYYGGRGIKVCDEWEKSYSAFKEWAYENGYAEGLTIERIDVNKGYSPENCTWLPSREQAINRRSTVWIEWNGERRNIKQWADHLGIKYGTLHSRYYRSKMRPPELFEPVKNSR